MGEKITPLPPPSRAQNRVALAIAVLFLAFTIGGGWFLRTHREGAASPGEMANGTSPGALPAKTVNGVTVDFRGGFRMPSSEIQMEFKNAEGQLVEVGAVKVALNMNMPGMVMHGDAEVRGAKGRYTAKLNPQMVGDWTMTLSFNGPQGPGETRFRVSVK